jgi:hypothetical protein
VDPRSIFRGSSECGGDLRVSLRAGDGLIDTVERLLDAGANPNLQRHDDGTALMEPALDGIQSWLGFCRALGLKN